MERKQRKERKMNNMKTLRVTGKGQIKVRPDMTRITLTLVGTYPEYGEALHHSVQDTDQLKDILSPYGFERSDLKTLSFNVDTKYESYREGDEYKQRLVGYEYRHALKVEFESESERLGKVLHALAHSPLKPEFRISYTVKDREAAKNELLGKAVLDAREKAAVLTRAADVELKDIRSIDYSWGELELEVSPMNRAMLASPKAAYETCDSYSLDIQPDDIEVSDTVTVVWEIG